MRVLSKSSTQLTTEAVLLVRAIIFIYTFENQQVFGNILSLSTLTAIFCRFPRDSSYFYKTGKHKKGRKRACLQAKQLQTAKESSSRDIQQLWTSCSKAKWSIDDMTCLNTILCPTTFCFLTGPRPTP